ncbi:MAG: 4-alpha-glucanotransferase [Anaerolineales bacterium]|nr:4-alpha-glucanotransferase [Anaerolineales bacterium]
MTHSALLEQRRCGLLLHPTSLPGPHGIGDFGPAALAWLEWLASTGSGLWQVLPLGPTGYGDSPYQSFSSFAGNPLLISPDLLVEEGLIRPGELEARDWPTAAVDFGQVIPYKRQILELATSRLRQGWASALTESFQRFCAENASWLQDYARFMAIKGRHAGRVWTTWPEELVRRDPRALARLDVEFESEISQQQAQQFFFFRQWQRLRDRAQELGIAIIGDIPIFVAHDSADVWANQHLFALKPGGDPKLVAGVPPDYFAPTGQLWGNPLYAWEAHRAQGYEWWISRFRAALHMVDIVRLDHFRGIEAYWEIPADAPTAETGRWMPGPGQALLEAVDAALGELPVIAEDLGFITPGVIALRDHFRLPGMKILQFGFGSGPEDPFLPHNYPVRCVVYTGTHDNDTVVGWYQQAPEAERDYCRRYLARDGSDIAFDMIRAAWASVAGWAIAPLQDALSLGPEARMNFPGKPDGNWTWRFTAGQMTSEAADRLQVLAWESGRLPQQPATLR